MKQLKGLRAGILALAFTITMIACGGKAQPDGGGNAAADLKQAADKAENAVKDAAGKAVSAVKGAADGGKAAEASDFIYRLNTARDGVVITGIQKDAKFGAHLVVPAEIEGYPVVAYLVPEYGEDASGHGDPDAKKRNQPPLESVILPDSITYLGGNYYDFVEYGWIDGSDDNLKKDYGSEGKFEYGYCSFIRCGSLKSIVFPKNVKFVLSLRNLPNLKPEGITWPEALEVMAGFGNDSTTEVVIPDGVKIILDGAFSDMKNLTTVTIPDSVEKIEGWIGGAFSGCPELTTVKIPAHPIEYEGGGDSRAFGGCPKLGIAAQKAIKDTGYTGTFR